MGKKILAGNWKMNKSLGDVGSYIRQFAEFMPGEPGNMDPEVMIAFPSLFVSEAVSQNSQIGLQVGCQNVNAEASGAFTGEVSVSMVKDIGCQFTLVGHSERRQLYRESDLDVAKKVNSCLEQGLKVVFCCGETLEERELGVTEVVLRRQLTILFPFLSSLENLVLAYEPVWAIGTGMTATPDQAQQAHAYLRQLVVEGFPEDSSAGEIAILYGGSVKPANFMDLMEQEDIDGALVGGACLDPEEFGRMYQMLKKQKYS